MEFLDNLVLPQSSEHIELLHYMLILIFFLFVPFISIILGGTSLSLYYRRKGINEGNKVYLKFAKDVIELVTINKSIGIILGIVPLFTSILIFAQLLHTSNAASVTYLVFSFVFITAGLILIYAYRYSLSFINIFNILHNQHIPENQIAGEIDKFKKGNEKLSAKSGAYGFMLLIIGLWLFTGAYTITAYPDYWGSGNLLFTLFSWKVIASGLQYIAYAFAITGGAILFGYFYWDGGIEILDPAYKKFVKKVAVYLTLGAALVQPLFLFLNTAALPRTALSGGVFSYAAVSLVLLFLLYHFLYGMIKNADAKYSGAVFFMVLFSLLAVIVKDQLAMKNSTKPHAAVLSHEYEKFLVELKGESAAGEILTGQQIFDIRCSSCHTFEQKLVGPAYNDVLPKYQGNLNALVAFIRNPAKIDPAYPPMPNPGLRPQEAEAIATYLLEEFDK
jgi:cytochrome c551/c552